MILLQGPIAWQPKTKDRPRHRGRISYTPKPTKDAEAAIVWQLHEAGLIPEEPFEDPLRLGLWFGEDHIWFEMESVSDYSQKGMHRDVDNMQKLVMDAMNGIMFVDDRQVVDLRGVKL